MQTSRAENSSYSALSKYHIVTPRSARNLHSFGSPELVSEKDNDAYSPTFPQLPYNKLVLLNLPAVAKQTRTIEYMSKKSYHPQKSFGLLSEYYPSEEQDRPSPV